MDVYFSQSNLLMPNIVPAGSFMTDLETDTSSKNRLAFHATYKIIHISCKWLRLGKMLHSNRLLLVQEDLNSIPSWGGHRTDLWSFITKPLMVFIVSLCACTCVCTHSRTCVHTLTHICTHTHARVYTHTRPCQGLT